MSSLVTTVSPAAITQRTNTYAAATMLAHAGPVMVLEKTAMNVMMPKNKGDNIKWRRPKPFTAATTPLVEGVTPSGRQFEFEDVTATLKQYGDFTTFTDVVQDLHEDPVGQQISIQHGENIGRTFEALDWGVVQGGSAVTYANGGARNTTNTPISLGLQRAVVRSLKNQKAQKFTSVIESSPNFATRAIEASYIAVAHTDLENDIRNMPGFMPTAQYGRRSVICPEEIGAVEDVRYVLSPDLDAVADVGGAYNGSGTSMVSTSGTLADIYPVIYFGKDAWARVAPRIGPSGQMPISVKTKMPNGEISDSDPLAQRGIVSWKGYYVSKILNENWIRRLEVAATAL